MNIKKIKNVYEQLVIKLEERSRLGGVMATMHWDQEVVMPKAAAENRSKQMAALAGVLHEKSVDVEIGRLIDELYDAGINNFHARISHRTSDDLGSPIVTIQPGFGHQNSCRPVVIFHFSRSHLGVAVMPFVVSLVEHI